mmetsp:Transcript_110097/g.311560  ORF Transcript_110097/g.311560 Transcript_110097/m.311560 type:complete len:229 (+) Transcript_110097:320-1006(+)
MRTATSSSAGSSHTAARQRHPRSALGPALQQPARRRVGRRRRPRATTSAAPGAGGRWRRCGPSPTAPRPSSRASTPIAGQFSRSYGTGTGTSGTARGGARERLSRIRTAWLRAASSTARCAARGPVPSRGPAPAATAATSSSTRRRASARRRRSAGSTRASRSASTPGRGPCAGAPTSTPWSGRPSGDWASSAWGAPQRPTPSSAWAATRTSPAQSSSTRSMPSCCRR